MKRRAFLAAVGGAAAWPLAARAEQPAMPTIGYLHQGSARLVEYASIAFRDGLHELGYVAGENTNIVDRWADGIYERLPALAAELVNQHVNVIMAALLPAALAVKAVTATIPIVFISGSDPVTRGLVASLNRPGGNITGVTIFSSALIGKRVELMRQLVPNLQTVALLVNPNNPNAEPQLRELMDATRSAGLSGQPMRAGTEDELAPAFAKLREQTNVALVTGGDGFLMNYADQIVALAARHQIPAMYFQREFPVKGGLISYGPNASDPYRQAGVYVGRILKGAKPADLPVLQPTKFELVINLKTVKALGLEVPPSLLARADEVIE
ncbi:MAG: ABC transporter substrate-binding protein [Xanthobacteraceae bacterium]|nr:ABC transporter substrate-binding protein [Xanthobacteraceae bacterium]MBV9630811.1 ABC transporter substrate-binding protein [Xanthobacteraceae bacterium]